ncbi:MAG: hypothetical protein PHY72_03950 [Candidatus Pacebacteria bacterium]|nr:hypothetical protein [Candidatus Paceibacterota bacterium]
MSNIIALIIFGGSFIGLFYLIIKKVSTLTNLPEQVVNEESNLLKGSIKQGIFQKTDLIKQAVLRNRGVGVVGAVMTKTTGRFKTIFINHIHTPEDLEKIEKIHKEGDYWQKVEDRNLPIKKKFSQKQSKSKTKIIQASATEIIESQSPKSEVSPKPKKLRTRKRKAE